MNSEKKTSWKIPVIGLCFLVGIAAWLGFGERGLVHLYRKEIERQACLDRIRRLAEANQKLLDEVQRLRTDMKYVESVARKQLNLIRENEVIYRFSKDSKSDVNISVLPLEAQKSDQNRRLEKEARQNGKIK